MFQVGDIALTALGYSAHEECVCFPCLPASQVLQRWKNSQKIWKQIFEKKRQVFSGMFSRLRSRNYYIFSFGSFFLLHIFTFIPVTLNILIRFFNLHILSYNQLKLATIKGIVSRDWGELQMIPVDSLEVFSIAGSYFCSFLTIFSCLNL